MLRVFRHAMNGSSPGDVLVLSSRFEFQWAAYPIPLSQRSVSTHYFSTGGESLPPAMAYQQWIHELETLVGQPEKRSVHVVLFSSLPTFAEELTSALTHPQWLNAMNYRNLFVDRSFLVRHYAPVDRQLRRLADRWANAHYFDVLSAVCPPALVACSTSSGTMLIFRDESHLTAAGTSLFDCRFVDLLQRHIYSESSARSSLALSR